MKKDARKDIRVDRWLWAARFYKSRTLATRACDGGKVDVNGSRAKAHKSIRAGDIVEFTVGDWRRKVKILGLSDKRGPASTAQLLYDDLSPPPPSKDAWLHSPPVGRPKGTGRPTKRERRQIRKWKGR
jgi:ribosome-associated heat shock protein Hsp15